MPSINRLVFTLCLVSYICVCTVCSKKESALKHYEELDYDDFTFKRDESNKLKRSKRQLVMEDNPIVVDNRLQFTAYNRSFDIYLRRETTLVTNNFDIEVRYETSMKPNVHLDDIYSENFYTGFVHGEPRSLVTCFFEMKTNASQTPIIFAQIQIESDQKKTFYYVEPVTPSDSDVTSSRQRYIIYRSEDIATEIISNDRFNRSFCKEKFVDFDYGMNSTATSDIAKNIKVKRQAERKNDGPANRCSLALVADYRFNKEIGNSNERLTTAYLMNIIGAVNVIFTRTSWMLSPETDDRVINNYGFTIEKIIIYAEPTEKPNGRHYNQKENIFTADEALNLFGEDDWSAYCLAHLFTFQGFEGNVLGLAYVSSPLMYAYGGICSPKVYSSQSKQKISVNTGISSYKSMSEQQSRLIQREAELVTAHEFGHNWGSEHDPPKLECTPPSGPNGGNFIMFAYANQGQERNNNYFSPCSIRSISQVLKSKATCFKPEPFSYCGNYRIEDQEECDGGSASLNGKDPCCDSKCKLKPGAVCSDSNHECCFGCRIAPSSRVCYSSPNYLDCFEDHSYCDGLSKNCPVQKAKPAGTLCSSFDKGRCDENGHCLSLCQQRNPLSMPCLCSEKEKRCQICCRLSTGNETGECKPYHLSFAVPDPETPRMLSKGRVCFNGLCDEKGVCQPKVKDYVSRFWKVIQTVTVSSFVEFMKRNIVGSIILISLLFWVPFSCCIHFCIDKRYGTIQRNIIGRRIRRMRSQRSEENRLVNDEHNLDEDDLANFSGHKPRIITENEQKFAAQSPVVRV